MGRAAGQGQSRRRRHHGIAAWLALFSIALQIVITAGHFHPEDFAFLAGDRGGAAMAAAANGEGQPGQPGGLPATPAHDDCALCVSLNLIGGSAVPAPPVLALPDAIGATLLAALPPPVLPPARHFLFRTRAPPVV
jgi:hypothetical protein